MYYSKHRQEEAKMFVFKLFFKTCHYKTFECNYNELPYDVDLDLSHDLDDVENSLDHI